MAAWIVMKITKVILVAAVAFLIFGFVITGLWNALIPELFHGPEISFWQGIGLLILSHILFRGGWLMRGARGWQRERWRHKFESKLARMSPKEREAFHAEYRRRCGSWDQQNEQNSDHKNDDIDYKHGEKSA